MHKNSKGFTLVEVMVAVAVFAAMAVSMSLVSSQSSVNSYRLEQKTVALWVAQNQLVDIKIKPFPNVGESKADVTMGNRDWKVVTKVNKSKFENLQAVLREVEIEVFEASDESRSVYTLNALIGKN